MSSDQPLEQRTLGKIYDEIIDHMKRSGAFDEVRVGLIDPIWSDPDFEKIVNKFKTECEQFCEKSDLSINRNLLRSKLAARFDDYSSTGRMVKYHISQLLVARNQELKSKYYEHAGKFLKQFVPREEEKEENQQEEENQVETQKEEAVSKEVKIEDEEEESAETEKTKNEVEETPVVEHAEKEDKIKVEVEEEELESADVESMSISASSMEIDDGEEIERPVYSPIGEDANEELEQLTFSSVSSVNTADLSDFDNSIKLSDDEANIVGKPKNTKVPIEVIQGSIKNLQTTSVDCKQEQIEQHTEPNDASESDGGCSESTTTGRRLARTRKSNPKYSTFHLF